MENQYIIEWEIKSEALANFKELAKEAIKLVLTNEPQMKGYQWYFNDEEDKCYTAEWHSSSDSMLSHLKNVNEILPKFLDCASISRFEVFGNLNTEALKAVQGMGAKVFRYYDGFTR